MISTKPISPAFAFGQAIASEDNRPSDGAPSIVPELPVSKGYLLPDGDILLFEDPSEVERAATSAGPRR